MEMFPLRVLVESVRPQHCISCAHDGHIILDTFAIVSGQTPLNQLNDSVLSALGLPHLIQDSRGLIQIKNWKAFPLDAITDNQDELIINLFKEISSSITLKVLTKHTSTDVNSTQCITDLKQRLLKVALDKHPHILNSIENAEVKEVIQQLSSGEELTCQLTSELIVSINDWLDHSTRFNNSGEIQRLERWFKSDANPSRQKLLSYMNIMNNTPHRKTNNKVTYQQICNWFANQRASNRSNSRPSSQASNRSSFAAQQQNNALALITAAAAAAATTSSNSGNASANQSSGLNFNSLLNSFSTSSPTNGSAQHNLNSATSTSSQIPVSALPMDIRSKFSSSNNYNPLMDRQSDGEVCGSLSWNKRIDGGSESPTGNDDVSAHSPNSENYDADVKESCASTPDLLLDVNALSPNVQTSMDTTTTGGETATLNENNSVQTLLNNAAFQGQNDNESPNSSTQMNAAAAAAAFSSFFNAAQLNTALFASTSNVLGAAQSGMCSSPLSNSSCNGGAYNNNNSYLLKSNHSSGSRDENGSKYFLNFLYCFSEN